MFFYLLMFLVFFHTPFSPQEFWSQNRFLKSVHSMTLVNKTASKVLSCFLGQLKWNSMCDVIAINSCGALIPRAVAIIEILSHIFIAHNLHIPFNYSRSNTLNSWCIAAQYVLEDSDLICPSIVYALCGHSTILANGWEVRGTHNKNITSRKIVASN